MGPYIRMAKRRHDRDKHVKTQIIILYMTVFLLLALQVGHMTGVIPL